MRNFVMLSHSPLDKLIINFDQGLRTVFGQPLGTERENPATPCADVELNEDEQKLSARLMRINHAGEVCAQALYQGQGLTARDSCVQTQMQQAAQEENDHLLWCEQRVHELGDHVSILNPLWYTGSFVIGALAGIAGDKWSLGFVAETEKQVIRHLDEHLERSPAQDEKSRAILQQMRQDEGHHATVALEAGGVKLPLPIRVLMKGVSKVMTKTAFWV
jgi:ubiquinone biosynthesis monooxygenase Coq7